MADKRKPKEFTEQQVAAIQPFIPALLKRYREVAATGGSGRPDPICAKVVAGKCYECPVFGAGVGQQPGHWTQPKKGGEPQWVEGEEWLHCEEGFWPKQPPCVDDTREGVSCGSSPDAARKSKDGTPQPTTRERAMAWGREMVARLEELRDRATVQGENSPQHDEALT